MALWSAAFQIQYPNLYPQCTAWQRNVGKAKELTTEDKLFSTHNEKNIFWVSYGIILQNVFFLQDDGRAIWLEKLQEREQDMTILWFLQLSAKLFSTGATDWLKKTTTKERNE